MTTNTITNGKNRKYNRPSKNIMRQHQLKRCDSGIAKSAMFIVTPECLCVQEAHRQKTINYQTTIHAVNNDRKQLILSVMQLQHLGYKNIVAHWGDVQDLRIGFKLDFAFIDTCSCLSVEFADWIENELWPNINPGGSVAFTFCATIRSKKIKPATIVSGVSDKFYVNNFDLDKTKDKSVIKMLKVLHYLCGLKMAAGIYKEPGHAQKMLSSRHDKTAMPTRVGLN